MDKDNLFYNKIVKQGNSLCVRIPLNISKKLNIKNGTIVAINLINMDTESKNLPKELIDSYQEVLKGFTNNEIREFLNNLAIETTTGQEICINNKYKKFKELMKKENVKEKIMKKIKETNFYKKSQISNIQTC